MSDRYHGDYRYDYERDDRTDRLDAPPRDVARPRAQLPGWLARKLLRQGEEVTSVRGPRWGPSWEPYVTHPGVILVGLALGAAFLFTGVLVLGVNDPVMAVPVVLALVCAVGGLLLAGSMAGYFTRLVVTSQRVLIVQGHEVRKTWRVEDLPRSLIRHTRREDGEVSRTVDMEKLHTLMGGGSDQFAEAKTIWALGKEIDRIKREDRRDDRRPPRDGEGW